MDDISWIFFIKPHVNGRKISGKMLTLFHVNKKKHLQSHKHWNWGIINDRANRDEGSSTT